MTPRFVECRNCRRPLYTADVIEVWCLDRVQCVEEAIAAAKRRGVLEAGERLWRPMRAGRKT